MSLPVPIVVLALIALVLVVLASHPRGQEIVKRLRGRSPQAAASSSPRAAPPAAPWRRAWMERVPYQPILLAGLALLVVISFVLLPRGMFAPREQFLVLVAPFRDPNGTVSEAGRAAARELVAALAQSGNQIVADTVDQAPASTADALRRMGQDGADALIYGSITSGGTLDQESLTPTLVYRPAGMFAPAGWNGYLGRFAMPSAYLLSAQPINGKVVVPQLITALAQYGAGQFDPAFSTLGNLLDEYPALARPLPLALRGNMLWATGSYRQAADAYRSTGVMALPPGQPTEMALLANNLGAILQDVGDPGGADAAFAQTVTLLNNQNLPELRLNVARRLNEQRNFTQAIAALEPMLTAQSPTSVRLALIDAYLGKGDLPKAQQALARARDQPNLDAVATSSTWRDLVQKQLTADVDERKVRYELAGIAGAAQPLLWSFISGAGRNQSALRGPYGDVRTLAERTNEIARLWRRAGVSADVDGAPLTAQIANAQARLTDHESSVRQTLQAGVQLALADNGNQNDGAIASVLAIVSGRRGASQTAKNQLIDLLKLDPTNVNVQMLLGFAYLGENNPGDAQKSFEAADRLAKQQPEPVFGMAQVALFEQPDAPVSPAQREQAKLDLRESINRAADFYPGREQLATLAEQDSDWTTAITQRSWLAEHRGTTEDALALAAAFQKSGSGGFSQAERVLLPLANNGNVPALRQLSELYVAANDPLAAEATLARARQQAPTNGEIAYAYGQLLEQQGRAADARAQYVQAAQLAPNLAAAHVRMGQYYASEKQYPESAREYEAALKAGKQNADTLKAVGNVFLMVGENKRALDAYQSAVDLVPNDADAHTGLARAYLALNRQREATEQAQKAIELAGGNQAEAQVVLGDVLLAQGKIDDAVVQYTAARNSKPTATEPYLGLGRAEAARGNWNVAQSYFQQAITIDPQSAEAHTQNGAALLQIKNIPAARLEFDTALGIRSAYPQAIFGLAQVYAANGDYAAAHKQIDEALQQNPNYAEAFLLDGILYEQQAKPGEARNAYGRAIQSNREFAEAYYRRALLAISQGNLPDARPDLEAAIRKRDNFPEAHYWLGRTYLTDDKFSLAEKQFDAAIGQTNNNYPEALFYKAVAEERMGNLATAYTTYKSALERGANTPWAGEAQAAIERLGG